MLKSGIVLKIGSVVIAMWPSVKEEIVTSSNNNARQWPAKTGRKKFAKTLDTEFT